MIEFEWYIQRAKINLALFFEVENIKSDEDLIEYCKSKSLSLPKAKYFPEKVEISKPEVAKSLKQPALEKSALELKDTKASEHPAKETKLDAGEELEAKEEKPLRKTRRRTTKTTKKKTAK